VQLKPLCAVRRLLRSGHQTLTSEDGSHPNSRLLFCTICSSCHGCIIPLHEKAFEIWRSGDLLALVASHPESRQSHGMNWSCPRGSSLTVACIESRYVPGMPVCGWLPICSLRQHMAGDPTFPAGPCAAVLGQWKFSAANRPLCAVKSRPKQARFRLRETDPFSLAKSPGFARAHSKKRQAQSTKSITPPT
jgi:hypothetical protein